MPPKPVSKVTKKKVNKSGDLSEDQLNEEVDTFLTIYNPYVSQNCVEFDQTTRSFKPVSDHRKPVVCFRNLGSIKRKLIGEHGVVYEEVRVADQQKNNFNFRSLAIQTNMAPQRDQNEYTDPNLYPVLKFQGSASKSEIIQAYEEHEKMKKDENGHRFKGDLKTLLKFTGRKELVFHENNRKYLKLCERILDQNITEANLDCVYYDNPGDEFRRESGSLLPLWHIAGKRSRGMPVADICWHPAHADMLAVGHRGGGEDEDDLGLVREGGCVCVWTLKSPSNPDRIIVCAEGVSRVSFHPSQRHLVAVAGRGGAVAVCDIVKGEGIVDSKFEGCCSHRDRISQIEWLPVQVPQKFCSLSHDGKLIQWQFLTDELFPSDLVTELKLKESPLEAPPGGLEMNLEPKAETGDDLGMNSRGTALSVHPESPDSYLAAVGSGGAVQVGSLADQRSSAVFAEHAGRVKRVAWNPIHPGVFLSCATDCTVRVWDSEYGRSVFEFFFEHEVEDVAWAPYSATVFAAITARSAVSVFDLSVNQEEAVGTYTVYTRKEDVALTRISFNPNRPLIAVGDEKGCVTIYKLSPNVRASLKNKETLEKSKFLSGEMAKMNRLLAAAKVEEKR